MKIDRIVPNEIESRSMQIITGELDKMGIVVPDEYAPIVKRAIHTTADFVYAKTLVFSENALAIFAKLVRDGADIVADTNMALAGINKNELAKYGGSARCYMADPDVVEEAQKRGVTRAYVSMERAAKNGKTTIFAIGNAPTALACLREMFDSGKYKPDFIIGVPVGFVNVEAAKESILETPIPSIVNRGRKGGSGVAVAICNALLYEMRKGNL